MLRIGKAARIALAAMVELARAGDECLTTSGISERYGISPHHLTKILQQLAKAGLVQTTRGIGGGHRMARSPRNLTLADVIEAVRGPMEPSSRSPGARPDGDEGVQVGPELASVFSEIDQQIVATLRSISIATIVKKMT